MFYVLTTFPSAAFNKWQLIKLNLKCLLDYNVLEICIMFAMGQNGFELVIK